MNGVELIAAERQRQIEAEGWTPDHDDQHDDKSLGLAAACYAIQAAQRQWLLDDPELAGNYAEDRAPSEWPWDAEWWKPKDPIRDLARAGALIAAEIDRLQRKAANA